MRDYELTGQGTIKILLVDDQPLLRMGFRLILEGEDDLTVVGEASDGAEAVRLVEELQPDVVLMDVRMPAMDGIEATRRISAAGADARVIILPPSTSMNMLSPVCRPGRPPSS